MEIMALAFIAIPTAIAFYAIYKIVGFFKNPQTTYLYETVQDSNGNAVETVVTKTLNN